MWNNLATFELMGCLAKERWWELIIRLMEFEVDRCGEFPGYD
jgi:hypothetical protein